MTPPLLRLDGVRKVFASRRRLGMFGRQSGVTAVDGVSFALSAGETLALVGESGCGKSTLARLVLRLIEPTSGTVTLGSTVVTALSPNELLAVRRDV